MISKNILQKQNEEILKRVCLDNGVELELIKDLIKAEKDSRLRSRHGIYSSLKSKIQNYIQNNEN